jgi:hypothetical protein
MPEKFPNVLVTPGHPRIPSDHSSVAISYARPTSPEMLGTGLIHIERQETRCERRGGFLHKERTRGARALSTLGKNNFNDVKGVGVRIHRRHDLYVFALVLLGFVLVI